VGNANVVGDLRRLIVFDLDGTLIDSRRDLADAANALIAEHGGQPLSEDAIGRMVGDGAAVLVRRALDAAHVPVEDSSLPRFLELYDERLLATTRAYPGIPEALEALSPTAAIAVLTNKPSAPTRRILEELRLSRFVETTIGGDSRFPKKPDPTALQHLIEAFGAAPRSTAMVGDSWVDYNTARAAGTWICLARYGFGYHNVDETRFEGDEAVVDEPSQIVAAIARLTGRV
jgi:phosphoglycolate phosphatase